MSPEKDIQVLILCTWTVPFQAARCSVEHIFSKLEIKNNLFQD